MRQSGVMSLAEAGANVVVGYGISELVEVLFRGSGFMSTEAGPLVFTVVLLICRVGIQLRGVDQNEAAVVRRLFGQLRAGSGCRCG